MIKATNKVKREGTSVFDHETNIRKMQQPFEGATKFGKMQKSKSNLEVNEIHVGARFCLPFKTSWTSGKERVACSPQLCKSTEEG